jgi:hypothetical protein
MVLDDFDDRDLESLVASFCTIANRAAQARRARRDSFVAVDPYRRVVV